MQSHYPGTSRLSGLAFAAALLILLFGAVADDVCAQDSGGRRALRIEAGPLDAALTRLGRETGVLISFSPLLTGSLQTPGIEGSYTIAEALAGLLAGTGLEATGNSADGYVLQRTRAPSSTAPADSIMTSRPPSQDSLPDLVAPAVTVTGQRLHDVGPMPGLALTREQIPGNVQTITAEDIKKSHSLNLGSVMNSQMQSVNVNDYAGNPFQMDVTYRGFTASPQLGTPQGLSVFFDGIRVNEPFGDVVNWDLIPVNAISSVDMFPGSNPIFGLGTLGGAMSIRTKSGFTDPGASVEVLGGSWGRKQLQLSAGNNNGVVAGFVALSLFDEDGWRDNSPSKVNQMFGKLEWRSGGTTLGLSSLYAKTDLVGNGLIPWEMYDQRAESVFTSPDETNNELLQFQLSGAFEVTDKFNVTSQMYRRISKRRAINGDVYGAFDDLGNDHDYGRDSDELANNNPLCQYQDVNQNGLADYYLDVNNNNVADPGEINAAVPPGNIFQILEVPPLNNPTNAPGVCNPVPAYAEPLRTRNGKAALDRHGRGVVGGTPIGQIDTMAIDQVTDGGALQFNWNLDRHKFMVGGSYDSAYAEYFSTSQLAMIDPAHNVYLAPNEIDPLYYAASHPVINNTFDGTSTTGSLYFSETWSALDNLFLAVSGRYNHARVKNNLTSRPESIRVDLHNMRDFGAVPDIILCPTSDPASCPSVPNAARRLTSEGMANGTNGYYRPTGEGFQFDRDGIPETFDYHSFNPSLGVSYLPTENLNLFANWNKGARTPSVIELGCAWDKDNQRIASGHCTLPSTLSGDPYLPQIRSTTTELGARGTFSNGWEWNTSIYRTDLKDDIYFVGFTPTRNYFDTIGDTRRQGLELGLSGRSGRLDFRVGYALTHATFQSTFWQSNMANSSTNRDPNNGVPPGLYPYDENVGGAVLPTGNTTNRDFPTWRLYRIDPGDRMPGIPLHNLNMSVGYALTERWDVGLTMIARSSAISRGNENNDHAPGPGQGDQGVLDCNPYFDPDTGDFTGYFQCLPISLSTMAQGQPYLHDGKTPGYAIFNLETSYKIEKNLTLSFQISNLFDKKYYTASRLDVNPFSPKIYGDIGSSGFNYNSLDWQNTTFVAPGAPRGYFLSLTYEFGVN